MTFWQTEPISEFGLSVIRSNNLQEAPMKEKIYLPAMKLNPFANHSNSYIIKNTTGELFTYTPSGKVRSSEDISKPFKHPSY